MSTQVHDCDICSREFTDKPMLCERCEATMCPDCVADIYNELVGICDECHMAIAHAPVRQCHHYDLEAECGNALCPQKAVCRRVRQEAGSQCVESLEVCGPEEADRGTATK